MATQAGRRTRSPRRREPWIPVAAARFGAHLAHGLAVDRIVGLALWAGWIVYTTITSGVPTNRRVLMALAAIGLMLTQLGKGWRRVLQVLIDWIPFTAALMLYDVSRGIADTVGMPLHESDAVGWEKGLFGGPSPLCVLQQHSLRPGPDPLVRRGDDDRLHHPLPGHTDAGRHACGCATGELWLAFTARIMVLSVAGLVTYILFPEAPPWMAARDI